MSKIISALIMACLFTSCLREPEACFDTSKYSFAINESIQFEDCSKRADRVEWDFGDGVRSDENSPQHAYTKNGHYIVIMRAFNNNGEEDYTQSIDIGRFTLGSIQVDSVWDTVTYPRERYCTQLYFTHDLDAFAYGVNRELDCLERFQNLTYEWGAQNGDVKSIPTRPNLSFIHYYYVYEGELNDLTDKLVFDTLYADSTIDFNLIQNRTYNDVWFHGSGVHLKADLQFGFEVDN